MKQKVEFYAYLCVFIGLSVFDLVSTILLFAGLTFNTLFGVNLGALLGFTIAGYMLAHYMAQDVREKYDEMKKNCLSHKTIQ